MSRWGRPREWREGICVFTPEGRHVRVIKVHMAWRRERVKYLQVVTLDEKPTHVFSSIPAHLTTRDPTTRTLAVRGWERGR